MSTTKVERLAEEIVGLDSPFVLRHSTNSIAEDNFMYNDAMGTSDGLEADFFVCLDDPAESITFVDIRCSKRLYQQLRAVLHERGMRLSPTEKVCRRPSKVDSFRYGSDSRVKQFVEGYNNFRINENAGRFG